MNKRRWHNSIIVFALVLILIFSLTACGKEEKVLSIKQSDSTFTTEPCDNDGEPFCIAVLDEYPAIESSYLWLKGMLLKFQSMGYIDESIDFSKAPEDFDGLYDYLLKQDIGDYISFDKELYYLDTSSDNSELIKKLTQKVDSGDIDVIACTGTSPGVFLKELDLDVPFLVGMASDPVASGIIESSINTGDENIWALVEPNPMKRQFIAYHDLFNFKNFGILYLKEYEDILFINSYEEAAEELGVKFTKAWVNEADWDRSDYPELLKKKVRELVNKGIDAFMISIAVLPDDDASLLSSILEEEGIPYLVTDGNYIVETGGLFCIGCYDYEGYGNMEAMVMSDIFHGEKAGDQPCVYVSSPVLALNLSTAKKIGMKTEFTFLQTLDLVYKDEH